MSPGNLDFVQVVSSMVLAPAAVALVVVTDERRLSAVQRARAWPAVSRDFAIFGVWQFGALYGCLALVVHFARTRASLSGLALGAFWAILLLATVVGTGIVIEVVAGPSARVE